MYTLVLLRHGESTWNKSNRFTGWTDVDLTPKGVHEAHEAGKVLREKQCSFDLAYTSVLKRAVRTLWIVLDEMDLLWIPVEKTWRLNERHYGALQGLNKAQMAKKYGEEQVHLWRRSYGIRPPALDKSDHRWPGFDPRYQGLRQGDMPLTESLQDTVHRVEPCWRREIIPQMRKRKRIIIVASGNSIRALIREIDGVSEADIVDLTIPTGIPLVYELDRNLKPIRHYYLADEVTVAKAIAKVKNQGKVKR